MRTATYYIKDYADNLEGPFKTVTKAEDAAIELSAQVVVGDNQVSILKVVKTVKFEEIVSNA